jgi:hypothetical protein
LRVSTRHGHELIAACLHALDERFFSWFVHEVEASTDDPYGRLLAVFDVLDLWFRRRDFRGCAFINATVELASPRHPAAEAVMAHKTRCRRYFRALPKRPGRKIPTSSLTSGCYSPKAPPLPRSSKEI